MTSNHWDSRNPSGFYTLLEDEMFGKGKTNAGPAHRMSNTTKIIRRYGTLWENFHGQKVRMYLYEPLENNDKAHKLVELEIKIKEQLLDLSSLSHPKLQHNFAEDNGVIRDQLILWANSELFSINETIKCDKVIKIVHFEPDSKTAYDFHVRIN